ncbi:MAG: hypothetical protein J6N70_12410, partial [Oribacterium sp.]|nr:hypothetical protein [Oribacterium sp.]
KVAAFCVILITESSFGKVMFGGTYIILHHSVGFYLFSADIVSNFFEAQNVVVIGFVAVFCGYLPNSR